MKHFLKREPKELKISDLVVNRSFVHWVRNKDPEAEEFWTAWLMNNPEMEEKVEAARTIVLALQFRGDCISSRQVDAEWKKLYDNTGSLTGPSHKDARTIRSFPGKRLLSVAATLLFLVTFTLTARLLVTRFAANDRETETITSATSPGQKLSITLSDGTKIRLNSDSEIQYPPQFTGGREVFLKGEAFFNVAHNDQAPFKVHTGGVTVVVLGTCFNVNAYPENTDVRIALEKGKVKVDVKDDAGSKEDILLKPSELIRINKSSHRYEIQQYDPEEITCWKDGCLYLGKAGFGEIMVKLERWFGVTIEMDADLQIDPDWKFTGRFHDKSLPYILSTLGYPDLFKYRIEEKKVVIY